VNLGGLSPEKAPPVEAPLGLFYLMPLFLGLAGVVLAWQGDQVMLSRWTPAALAATHFIVLGALAPVMCGALLQISPVLFGAPYPRVRLVARLTAAGLGVGSLLIGSGFLAGVPALLLVGGLGVAAGLLVFLAGSYWALHSASVGPHQALWTVRLAVVALAVTVGLGVLLAMVRLGWFVLPEHLRWIDTHVSWGLAGWIGLLLAGVGMEIIPMFYISPPFSAWLKRALPLAVAGLLAMITVSGFIGIAPTILHVMVAALFCVHLLYNVIALYVESGRRRPRRDANLWLWQGSHVAVLCAFLVWLWGVSHSLVGILLLGSALSFMIGSLMKIVPFLSWLDLQQRRVAGRHIDVKLPSLRTFFPDRFANWIAITLFAAAAGQLLGAFLPALAQVGGLVLTACAGLLALALARSARIRKKLVLEFKMRPPVARSTG